jgi:hypothetical protein
MKPASPPQPATRRILAPLSRQPWLDLLIIAALCVPLCYLVITVPHDGYRITHTADNAWYMNRADLIWRGTLDDAFVYNFFHPALMGAINQVAHELPRAAIIVNWVALIGILVGTYLLGRVFYNRQIAWLALLLIATSTALYTPARLLHPFLLMQAVLVWTVLAAWAVWRWRTALAALGLGLLLVIALYTRLEGATYSLLILVAAWKIFQDTHDRRLALRLGAISAVVFGAGLLVYAIVLFSNSDSGGGAFSLAALFRTNPVFWDDVSHRWMETIQYMAVKWPAWAWAVALAGVTWSPPRLRLASRLFAGLTLLHVVYLFLLSTWPAERYANNSLAFFALLFAAALWQFYQRRRGWWPVVPLVMVAIMLPGMILLVRFSDRASNAENYWDYEIAQVGQAVDAWLTSQGLQDTEIFTLCQQPLAFSTSHFHLIYRLSLTSLDEPTLWNSPTQLLPRLREEGKLFMTCNGRIWYQDWLNYFEQPQAYDDQLEEIGRVGDFIFYQVSQKEPAS